MAFDVRKAFSSAPWEGEDPRKQPLLVAELALWSAMADGDLVAEEIEAVAATVSQIPALADFDTQSCLDLIEHMAERHADSSSITKRVVEICLALTDPTLRRLAYKLAVLCASTDGSFSDEETEFLGALQDSFKIDDAEAETLVREVFAE